MAAERQYPALSAPRQFYAGIRQLFLSAVNTSNAVQSISELNQLITVVCGLALRLQQAVLKLSGGLLCVMQCLAQLLDLSEHFLDTGGSVFFWGLWGLSFLCRFFLFLAVKSVPIPFPPVVKRCQEVL